MNSPGRHGTDLLSHHDDMQRVANYTASYGSAYDLKVMIICWCYRCNYCYHCQRKCNCHHHKCYHYNLCDGNNHNYNFQYHYIYYYDNCYYHCYYYCSQVVCSSIHLCMYVRMYVSIYLDLHFSISVSWLRDDISYDLFLWKFLVGSVHIFDFVWDFSLKRGRYQAFFQRLTC